MRLAAASLYRVGTPEKQVDLSRADLLTRDASSKWRAWLPKEMPSFETIPFEKIGLQKDEYRRTLPARLAESAKSLRTP